MHLKSILRALAPPPFGRASVALVSVIRLRLRAAGRFGEILIDHFESLSHSLHSGRERADLREEEENKGEREKGWM